ncbi:MAG: type II secretion system F family protein [Chloroflexota bacterium]
MIFEYVAYNTSGEVVKGRLPASNEDTASDLLGYAGYKTITIRPYVPFFSSDRLSAEFFRVKPSEVILFYRQLALLLESGINIVTSLELLLGQTANRAMKKVLEDIISDLRRGNQLSAAMGKHPEVFPPISCRTLSIGEQTGGLEEMLRQMADYLEKEQEASKGIKSALMYPIIAAVVTVIVVVIMAVFVLPAFSDLYSSLGAEMPALTRFVIDGANKLRENGLIIMLGLVVGGGLLAAYVKTPEGKFRMDKLALELPLIGRVNQISGLSRMCRSISLLFRSGLPLTEIMPLIIQGTGNRVMAEALKDVQQEMLRGHGLSQPMQKNQVFLPMMVQMVKVGEETGNLDITLLSVAQSYETEAEDATRSLIGMIQPAMTLIIAVIVGVIAMSLVSAMYSIYGQT